MDLSNYAQVLAKASVPRSRPSKESLPELPDVLRLARAAIGLGVGLLCGALGLTGWSGFVLYALLAVGGGRFYVGSFLEANVESYAGGAQGLLLEGLQPGIALCMLAWTALFQFTRQQ